MGCNDYYDSRRDAEDKRWWKNNKLINELDCKRVITGSFNDFVACCKCGAMIWTGDLRREDDLPFVRIHHQHHTEEA